MESSPTVRAFWSDALCGAVTDPWSNCDGEVMMQGSLLISKMGFFIKAEN